MLRAQRILIIIALLGAAALLHMLLCEWSWNTSRMAPIIGDRFIYTRDDGVEVYRFRGVFHDGNVERGDAIVFGIVTPLLMIVASVVLLIGGRHSQRVTAGRCLKCGYDLKGNFDQGCPECGWRRDTKH